MKIHLAYSSQKYLLNTSDVLSLEKSDKYIPNIENIVILLGNGKKQIPDSILSGREALKRAYSEKQEFIMVQVAYYTLYPIFGTLINLIKAIKRTQFLVGNNVYRTKLSYILSQNVTRGIRNQENAYALTNSKWKIPNEERKKRYSALYNSLQKHGYDNKHPILIALNRNLGIKDQVLQGHHRIGICQELGIEDISISFWAYPESFKLRRVG